MHPFKIFIPSHVDYLFASRLIRAAEVTLHQMKNGSFPEFYCGSTEYPDALAKDIETLKAADQESLRLGMHLAAVAIAHQMIFDMLENKKFFQATGKLESIGNKLMELAYPSEHGQSYEEQFKTREELEGFITKKTNELCHELTSASDKIIRHYPYQHILDLAQADIDESEKNTSKTRL